MKASTDDAAEMAKLQEESEQKTAEATVGAERLQLWQTEKTNCVSLVIKKEAVDPEDVEMLRTCCISGKRSTEKVQASLLQK